MYALLYVSVKRDFLYRNILHKNTVFFTVSLLRVTNLFHCQGKSILENIIKEKHKGK